MESNEKSGIKSGTSKKNASDSYAKIRVSESTASDLVKLASKHNRFAYEIADGAIRYFSKSGYNPCDMENIETPAEELKKLKNTVISFIRKQESDYIKPLVGKLDTAVSLLVEVARKVPNANEGRATEIERAFVEKLQGNKPSTKSAGGFLLPGSAADQESVTLNEEPKPTVTEDTNYAIAIEKRDNEILRLKSSLRELISRFARKGDSYSLSISRQEKESIEENCK